ncbi:hypothetical protein BDR03DRAFT_960923, partial [Suillus americanus]
MFGQLLETSKKFHLVDRLSSIALKFLLLKLGGHVSASPRHGHKLSCLGDPWHISSLTGYSYIRGRDSTPSMITNRQRICLNDDFCRDLIEPGVHQIIGSSRLLEIKKQRAFSESHWTREDEALVHWHRLGPDLPSIHGQRVCGHKYDHEN